MRNRIRTAWALHQLPVTIGILLIVIIFPFVFDNQYFVTVATLGGIYVVLSMSLNLICGFMGITSLGHAAFYGIGAYAAALLSTRLGCNFLITFVAAALLSLVAGLLLGIPTLRLKGRYLSIVTLAFCEIIRAVENNWRGLTRGAVGITGIPQPELLGFAFDTPRKLYYMIVVICVLTFVLISRLMNSRIGRGITAVKDDQIAAEAMGVKSFRCKMIAFGVSSMLAGIAGAFYAHYMSFISPLNFSFDQSTLILSMVILGGLCNLHGSIIGAVVLTVLPEILRPIMVWRQVIYGALLVIVILYKPTGLLGDINLKHIKQLTLFERTWKQPANTAESKEQRT